MFGKTFGRRRVSQSTLPAHPGPDADGVARVIPKEIFDGPTGAFLREIGFSPDDASNLMPTQHSVQAKANALEAEREDFVAGVNRALPAGCMVIPWALIPYRVWQGERAGFLMLTCDLYPASLFNTMLLPADAASAHTLGLPEHPRGPVDGIDDAAVRFLGELQAEYQASHQAVARAIAAGNVSALEGGEQKRREIAGNVVGLAHHLGSAAFGGFAWDRHRELFGGALWGAN